MSVQAVRGCVFMHILILCVGALKERYWRDALEEYLKRLSRYAKLTVREVADENTPEPGSAAADKVKDTEGRRLLQWINTNDTVCVLDERGEALSSTEFSAYLEECMPSGKRLVFVIGGSLGLSQEIIRRGNKLLSLGKMTYPHQMVRVILVEQIYRSYRIIRGEPYHK